jgi:prepilin-type processing-associated H-X9-DG protein
MSTYIEIDFNKIKTLTFKTSFYSFTDPVINLSYYNKGEYNYVYCDGHWISYHYPPEILNGKTSIFLHRYIKNTSNDEWNKVTMMNILDQYEYKKLLIIKEITKQYLVLDLFLIILNIMF